MQHLRMILLTLAAIPLAACALSGEAIEGRVLEDGTNKPIPGAIIVVQWQGTWAPPAGTSTCYHVESAVTDAQGHYKTAAWSGPFKFGLLADYWEVDAYKPGYSELAKFHVVQGGKSDISYLEAFKGTREERLNYLRSLSGKECGSRNDYAKKLVPLYRALYEEASSIAVTPEEKHIAGGLHYSLDRLEVGEETSLKRLSAGEYEK